jgi:hypothetical protein
MEKKNQNKTKLRGFHIEIDRELANDYKDTNLKVLQTAEMLLRKYLTEYRKRMNLNTIEVV